MSTNCPSPVSRCRTYLTNLLLRLFFGLWCTSGSMFHGCPESKARHPLHQKLSRAQCFMRNMIRQLITLCMYLPKRLYHSRFYYYLLLLVYVWFLRYVSNCNCSMIPNHILHRYNITVKLSKGQYLLLPAILSIQWQLNETISLQRLWSKNHKSLFTADIPKIYLCKINVMDLSIFSRFKNIILQW